ncbi:MAG: potassium channel family protein [Vicingaceae bacterium]
MFHSYRVEITSKAFEADDGRKFAKTAKVSLLDYNNKPLDIRHYGVLEKEQLYDLIFSRNKINLDDCYVKDFSLSEYRRSKGLINDQHVELLDLSARRSFFDADHEIDFSYAVIKGEGVSFRESFFCSGLLSFVQSNFDSGIKDFQKTFFNCKDVDFQYADFSKGDISFKDTIFQSENVSFINCNFSEGHVNFMNCDFSTANIAFQFAKFGDGDISFVKNVMLGKRIDFSKVEFGKGRVDFRMTEFGDGDLSFDECEMKVGKLRFRKAKFGNGRISFELAMLSDSDVIFERTEFGNGELTFFKANCKSVTFHSSHLNNYVDLRFEHCGKVDLTSTIIRDIVDLTNEKESVKIDEINFSGMRNLGKLFLDWYENDVKSLIYSQKDTSIRQKSEQFRMLKEEFRNLGQYTDEDMAYLEFKRLELKDRRNRALKSSKFNGIWIYPMYWGEYLIFDQIGHYATNPLRVLFSMVVSFWAITGLYVALILTTSSDIVSSVGDPDHLSLITKSIYHSAITFLTIGYGDYYPSGYIRWLSSLEGFIGLFLISYFTVAFARKVLR